MFLLYDIVEMNVKTHSNVNVRYCMVGLFKTAVK